jgi:glycosyl transferase family 25
VSPDDLPPDEARPDAGYGRRGALSLHAYCLSLGHRRAWEALVASGAEWGAILEDDAVLSPMLPAFLAELDGKPLPFDLIHFETSTRGHESRPWPLLCSDPVRSLACGVDLRLFASTGWGAAGYLVSRDAALRLIVHPNLFDQPMDIALFGRIIRPSTDFTMAQTDPALCAQMSNLAAYDHEISRATNNHGGTPTSRRSWIKFRRAMWLGSRRVLARLRHLSYRRRHIPFEAPALQPRGPRSSV